MLNGSMDDKVLMLVVSCLVLWSPCVLVLPLFLFVSKESFLASAYPLSMKRNMER